MGSRLINGSIKSINVRRTVRNWPEDIKAIVDGYRSYTVIPHAVQKDAIQNGWSARVNAKGKGWGLIFELKEENGKKFLLMTDKGTSGLTGRVLAPEEYEQDLPQIEKWGRFEGVAFTQNRSERTLGSRGRGKFIFVGASKEQTILYDTLRKDGSYRFGFRTVEKTESPIFSVDNDEGRRFLLDLTGNIIKPLSEIGARVIIVEPVEELISDIKNGKFIDYINETWWEIILKYEASITVISDKKIWKAKVPKEFNLVTEDSKNFKTKIIKNEKIGNLKVKNLHIIYNVKDQISEDLRGVAIQRDGMKICSIPPKYLSEEINERIYGFINFEADTEEMLLDDEVPEHYWYAFRKSLPGSIKRYIEEEIFNFAREKLGLGMDEKEVRRRKQRDAEKRALTAVNNFAQSLGIGSGPMKKKRKKRERERENFKEVRVQLEELILPRPDDLRVNYNESVQNIKARVINDSNQDIFIRIRLFLRFIDKEIKIYIDNDLNLAPSSISEVYGPFVEEFTESSFPDKGKYTIVAKIISLMDKDKGLPYDYKSKSFYLEEDPPQKGIFERCEPVNFPDDLKYLMGYSEYGSERGLILNYNVGHTGYLAVSEEEEDLAEYILRIAGPEVCRYDLDQDDGVLFKNDQRNEPKETLDKERYIIGELLYKFRKGEV